MENFSQSFLYMVTPKFGEFLDTASISMNKDMAKLHPEYAAFLEQLNERIYDLGDIVNLGYYLHPGFKGSWSIKHVLPVMVPELSYKGMVIGKGDQTSMA